MAKHSIAKKYNWSRIAIMIVAAVALVGIIIITVLTFVDMRKEEPLSGRSLINSIAAYEPLELVEGTKNINSAYKCVDYNGETIAYSIISTTQAGFGGEMTVRSYFDPTGVELIGVEVVEHNEYSKQKAEKKNHRAEHYGDEVADSVYLQRFERAQMPLWFNDGSVANAEKPAQAGTQIDALSGATESSNAVVLAVNEAYTYLTTNIVKVG